MHFVNSHSEDLEGVIPVPYDHYDHEAVSTETKIVNNGEIGCFLSHYRIWQKMAEDEIFLILEDDVHFGPNFVEDLRTILDEAQTIPDGWDMIYIGRYRPAWTHQMNETFVTVMGPQYLFFSKLSKQTYYRSGNP